MMDDPNKRIKTEKNIKVWNVVELFLVHDLGRSMGCLGIILTTMHETVAKLGKYFILQYVLVSLLLPVLINLTFHFLISTDT